MIKLKDLLKEQDSFIDQVKKNFLPKADTKSKSAVAKGANDSVITDSDYKAAMWKFILQWNPIKNQYKGKSVNFFKPKYKDTSGRIRNNELFGKYKIEDILLSYHAYADRLEPAVKLILREDVAVDKITGMLMAEEYDLKKNMFKAGNRGFGKLSGGQYALDPGKSVINNELAKSILSKWPEIKRLSTVLFDIKEKQRVPDADFTAAIDSELGNDDIQSTNIA